MSVLSFSEVPIVQVTEVRPSFEILHDALYLPARPIGRISQDAPWGLFGSDGSRFDAAAYRRSTRIWQPESVDIPDDVAEAEEGKYIYIGQIIPHYGHFLLSTLSRLWMDIPSDAKLVCHATWGPKGAMQRPHVREIFGALGIRPEQIVWFDRPTRIPSIKVPAPSFVEENSVYRELARLGKAVGKCLCPQLSQVAGRAQVWLSKTRLKHGVQGISNEDEMFPVLEASGIEIIYPEEHSLSDQIELFAAGRTVLGVTGSGFHTSILAPPNGRIIGLQMGERIQPNYLLIDAVNGNRASYFKTDVERVEDSRFDVAYRLLDPIGVAQALVREAAAG